MLSVALTRDQFTKVCASLESAGVKVPGDSGTLSGKGVEANYSFDGKTLQFTATKAPFHAFGLAEREIESRILAAIKS